MNKRTKTSKKKETIKRFLRAAHSNRKIIEEINEEEKRKKEEQKEEVQTLNNPDCKISQRFLF